jgi:hypothetical protein
MTDNVQTLAHQLADAEHELDWHLWQSQSPFYDALFVRSEEIRASIPDEIYFTPAFFAAYETRRAERNARVERGSPFAVVNGGAS